VGGERRESFFYYNKGKDHYNEALCNVLMFKESYRDSVF
jgi:hypothetical protein